MKIKSHFSQKVRSICIFTFALFLHVNSDAQHIYFPDSISFESLHQLDIDSLLHLEDSVVNDTLRVRIYQVISYKDAYINDKRKLKYINKALALSSKINYKKGIGVAKINLGSISLNNSDYLSAIQFYTDAHEIAETLKDTSFMIMSTRNIAHVYSKRNQDDEALKILYKAVEISEKMTSPTPKVMAAIHISLGRIYERQLNYKLAIFHFEQSLSFDKEGSINQIYTLANLASIHYQMKNYPEMLTHLRLVKEKNKKVNSPKIKSIEHYLMGSYNWHVNKDIKSAKTNLEKGLILAKEDLENREFVLDFLPLLIKLCKQNKEYKTALKYHEEFDSLNNIVQQNNNENIIAEIQAKYEKKESAAEISLLKKERTARVLQLKLNRIASVLIGVIAFGILMGVSMFFINKLRISNLNTQLSKKTEAQSREELKGIQQNLKSRTIISHLKGQLLERKRVAVDLHDSLGGLLASLKLKALNIKKDGDLNQIVHGLDKACNEVRSISHYLNPPEFQHKKFKDILEELIESFTLQQNSVLEINDYEQVETLSLEKKVETYRVIQELIYNTHRHAMADNVNTIFTFHEEYLNIIVEDDGIGFDQNKCCNGLGLQSINSRIENLAGTFHIDSSPGAGTIAQIQIPLCNSILNSFIPNKI